MVSWLLAGGPAINTLHLRPSAKLPYLPLQIGDLVLNVLDLREHRGFGCSAKLRPFDFKLVEAALVLVDLLTQRRNALGAVGLLG